MSVETSNCIQVKRTRTVTSRANSLMQAGADDDGYPVLGRDGTVDVLWITEVERSVICSVHSKTSSRIAVILYPDLGPQSFE